VVAISVTRRRHGIDPVDLVVRRDQCGHDETAVLFDADHQLIGFTVVAQMFRHERMQLAHPGERVADFSSTKDSAITVQDAHVVVGLSPIHPNKNHFATSR
jgi:hypothetical protein